MERNKIFVRFNKIVTSNPISELLKMRLESRSRNVHTKGTRRFISTHAVTTQKGIRGSLIGKLRSITVLVLGSSSTYSPRINHSGQDSLTKIFFEPQYFGLDLRLARTKTPIPMRSIQNADCRPGTK